MSRFTDRELADYQRDGFFIARGLFDRDEIDKLLRFAKEDPSFAGSVYGRKDASGHETKLALWNHAGDDLYSMFARSPRIVDRMEQALGGEVYLYHMKMMLKEPQGRRGLGMASGLRLLVSQRLPAAAVGELPDRRHAGPTRPTAACR